VAGRGVKRGPESPMAGRSSWCVCICLGCASSPGINGLLTERPPRPAHKMGPLPASLPTLCPPSIWHRLRVPPPPSSTPCSWAGLPRTKWLPPSSPPLLPLPPPPQNFLALGFAAELSSASVVPGCQRLYISALLMLILCNHFLLQNLLAAR